MDNTNNQPQPDPTPTTPDAVVTPETPTTPEPQDTKPAVPEVDLNEYPALDGFTSGDEKKPEEGKKEDEYDPYNVDNVRKIAKDQINEAVAPFQEQLYQTKVDNEVNKIMSDNPEYKPYEERVRKWVTHPNRQKLIKQGLPVKAVVYEALAPYLEKIGAEKARKADAEAKVSGTPTTTVKPTEKSGNPYSGMSHKDIENLANRVKAGQYKE